VAENTTFPIHNPPKSYLYPETNGQYVHQAFPKMVYIAPIGEQHPHDANKVVKNQQELDEALEAGYELKPVYPTVEVKKGRK
jgi:hypothetical protein